MGYGTQTFDTVFALLREREGKKDRERTKGGREDRYRCQLLAGSTVNVTMSHTKVP